MALLLLFELYLAVPLGELQAEDKILKVAQEDEPEYVDIVGAKVRRRKANSR